MLSKKHTNFHNVCLSTIQNVCSWVVHKQIKYNMIRRLLQEYTLFENHTLTYFMWDTLLGVHVLLGK